MSGTIIDDSNDGRGGGPYNNINVMATFLIQILTGGDFKTSLPRKYYWITRELEFRTPIS